MFIHCNSVESSFNYMKFVPFFEYLVFTLRSKEKEDKILCLFLAESGHLQSAGGDTSNFQPLKVAERKQTKPSRTLQN